MCGGGELGFPDWHYTLNNRVGEIIGGGGDNTIKIQNFANHVVFPFTAPYDGWLTLEMQNTPTQGYRLTVYDKNGNTDGFVKWCNYRNDNETTCIIPIKKGTTAKIHDVDLKEYTGNLTDQKLLWCNFYPMVQEYYERNWQ